MRSASVESTEFRRQKHVDIKEHVREKGMIMINWIPLTNSYHSFTEVVTQESYKNGWVRY